LPGDLIFWCAASAKILKGKNIRNQMTASDT